MPICKIQGWHSPRYGMHQVRSEVPLFLSLENLLGATVPQEGTHNENGLPQNLPLITSGLAK